jgi:hypothetical protein
MTEMPLFHKSFLFFRKKLGISNVRYLVMILRGNLSYKEICVKEVTCIFYLPPDSSCIIICPFYRSLILFLYRFERCSYVSLMCDAKLLISRNHPI